MCRCILNLLLALLTSVLVACGGPEKTLEQAHEAYSKSDLSSFEEAVDLERLSASILHSCEQLNIQMQAEVTSFLPKDVDKSALLEKAKLDGSPPSQEQMIELLRTGFPTSTFFALKSIPGCSILSVPEFKNPRFERSGSTAFARYTNPFRDLDGTLTLRLEELDGDWKITGVEANDIISSASSLMEHAIHLRIESTQRELLDEPDPGKYQLLKAYLQKKGPLPDLKRFLQEYEANLRKAPSPIAAASAALDRGLFKQFFIQATIQSVERRPIAQFDILISLADSRGKRLSSRSGKEYLRATSNDGISGLGRDYARWKVDPSEWPVSVASSVRVFPAEVRFRDGTTWTNPLLQHGLLP